MLFKKIGKKILIVLTCIMLVFSSTVKNTYALLGIDDITIAVVIGGLCSLAGITMITDDNFRSNASEVLTNAVNSYVDYYGGLASDAYDKVKEIATDIYASGCVLASDFNDWLHGWLGDFVNTYVLPTYGGNLGEFKPLFTGLGTLAMGAGILTLANGNTIDMGALMGVMAYNLYSPLDSTGGYYSYYTYADSTMKFEFLNDGLRIYTLSGNRWSPVSVYYTTKDDFRTNHKVLPLDVNIYFTGMMDTLFTFEGGKTAFYSSDTGKWTRDMEGTLELDPGVFNPDTLGDIDIAPPYTDGLLDNTLDYTNYWVLGGDMTFDGTGDMTYPGTLTVPKEWPYDIPWDTPYVDDYPYVIPTDKPIDKPIDIPKDDVIDRYPDIPIVTTPTYTADWSTLFPFCIPFDIFRFFELLSAKPKTPQFEFDYDIWGMKGTFEVDLSFMNGFASICRIGLDIVFILGLALATREKLIKA